MPLFVVFLYSYDTIALGPSLSRHVRTVGVRTTPCAWATFAADPCTGRSTAGNRRCLRRAFRVLVVVVVRSSTLKLVGVHVRTVQARGWTLSVT